MKPLLVGWLEWLALPDLGLAALQAKIDSGAKTSVLHASQIEQYQHQNSQWVRFYTHPLRHNAQQMVVCQAPLLTYQKVTNSGGYSEHRPLIRSRVVLGDRCQQIDITLTNRATMSYRMLLGRSAMQDLCINPNASYLLGKPLAAELNR